MKIKMIDTKGVYPSKVYDVEANSLIGAIAKAGDLFIKDNNHPAWKPGQSRSKYQSRFACEVVS